MRDPAAELADLAAHGLLRTIEPLDGPHGVVIGLRGRRLWNFASNDYLGLAADPGLAAALLDGVAKYGAGAGGSRLLGGTTRAHADLEDALAAAKQAGAAVVFGSGHAAALGALPALVGRGDTIVLDRLCHACLIDGARLSGARLRVFRHNDLDHLERLLSVTRSRAAADARILVVTESVFSMDGDVCPLPEIIALKERHGAWLMLDEAHAFGVFGPTGMGLAEDRGCQGEVDIQMGTLSKAAGLAGGFVACNELIARLLVNRARSFVFSTAPPPALCHAALAALERIRSPDGRSRRLQLEAHARAMAPVRRPPAAPGAVATPIVPVVLGDNVAALAASAALAAAGFRVPAIRYPTVPRRGARLRASLSSMHPAEVVAALARRLAALPAPG